MEVIANFIVMGELAREGAGLVIHIFDRALIAARVMEDAPILGELNIEEIGLR